MIYFSTAVARLNEAQISDLLKQSKANNARDGLTGLLVYHDRLFFQIIEGDRDKVEACYNRIQKDQRHRKLFLMWEGDSEKRAFDDWKMAYECEATHASSLSIQKLKKNPSDVTGGDPYIACAIQNVLSDFRELR
ncbi:BLUF domain-containing protein [Sulfitobacter marinus]|nr:BLUF domain-containing protein [Sulfitobacter marinus]